MLEAFLAIDNLYGCVNNDGLQWEIRMQQTFEFVGDCLGMKQNGWYVYEIYRQKGAHTVFGHSHIMINATGDLQVSRHCHRDLFFCQDIQLLKRILNIHPSHKPLQKKFFAMVSWVMS
jgi:hypothetical protein